MKLSDYWFASEDGNPNRNPDGTFASDGGDQSGSGGSDDKSTTSEKPKEKGKLKTLRDEHISKQRDKFTEEIKDWKQIASDIRDNMPEYPTEELTKEYTEKEKEYRLREYNRAEKELAKTVRGQKFYQDRLENLEKVESILSEIEVFDIASSRNKSMHEKGKGVDGNPLNTQYASDVKELDPKTLAKISVRYSGDNIGVDVTNPNSFVNRKERGGSKNDMVLHKKDVDEFFNGKTIMHGGNHIRSKDKNIANNAKAVLEAWDDFSDEQRNGIDQFSIKVIDEDKIPKNKTYAMGSWGKRNYIEFSSGDEVLMSPSTFTVSITSSKDVDPVKHTVIHESSHKTFDDLITNDPDKVKVFEDSVLALGKDGAITAYSATFFDKYEEFKKEMADPERLSLTTDDDTLAKKRNLVANEFHSEFISGLALPATSTYHALNEKNVKKGNDLIKELYKNAD